MKTRKMDGSFIWLLLFSGAIVLVVFLVLSRFRPQSSSSASRSPTPASSTAAYPAPGSLLPGYSTPRSSPAAYPPPAPTNTLSPSDKYYHDMQATGEVYWRTHPTPDQQTRTAPMPTRITSLAPTGIFEGDMGANPHPDEGTIINMWQGVINQEYMQVFAGALRKNPEQGVLFVRTNAFGGGSFSWEQFDAPSPSGALRILSEQNGRLKLVAENGSTFYFDAPSHQFIPSIDAISPATATLLPTGTPFLYPTPYP